MDDRLVLLLSMTVTLVSAASNIPKCNDDHIKTIKEYWDNNGGVPTDIIKSTATFHVVTGTSSPVADYAKCKHVSFSAPSGNMQSYTYNFQEENGKFPVTESSGVLTVDGGFQKFSIYVISFQKGMLVALKCSSDGPAVSSTVVADVTIGTSTSAKPDDVTAMTNTVKGMGFNVASFGCK